ncbi:MAG: hypothetical protein ACKOB5_01575, partial [Betaproteobacteria bacterium]
SWSPSVVIPVAVTAWRISPKLAVASLGGIVSMWGGFMITDFQQPPFMGMIQSALQGLQPLLGSMRWTVACSTAICSGCGSAQTGKSRIG